MLLLLSCNSNTKEVDENFEKVQAIITDSLKIARSFEHIFILSEYGCPVCNSILYNYMLKADHENSLYIISNLGSRLDLTKFETNISNATVVYDYRDLMYRSKMIDDGSAYIHIIDSSIDTIVNFNIENIELSISTIN